MKPTNTYSNAKSSRDRLNKCTSLQLRQFTRVVSQLYDTEMAKCGLKGTQYSLLSSVVARSPIRPADLASLLNMDPSTLTRNLKPLISAGWVDIEPGRDGRSRAVVITTDGQLKRRQANRCWRIAQDKVNQKLGLDRVHALHDIIGESLDLLQAPTPEASDE